MEQVLVRVTGRRDIATDPGVGELLAQPGAYVQQFRETDEGDLWVSFDQNAVDEVLVGSGLPIWGGERPAVLMLLAMDLGGGRRSVLAAEDEVPDPETVALRESVTEQAELRGLPFVLPLMDAQDRSVVSFTDLWGGFDQVLLAAAQRYDVDAVLLGRFRYDEPDRIRWTLFEGEESWRWTGRFCGSSDAASGMRGSRRKTPGEASFFRSYRERRSRTSGWNPSNERWGWASGAASASGACPSVRPRT